MLIGKWQLSKVGVETLSATEQGATIDFRQDGKLIIKVDSSVSEARWELSKDEKAVVLSDPDNEKKNWMIVSLTSNEFVYTEENDTTKITLIK